MLVCRVVSSIVIRIEVEYYVSGDAEFPIEKSLIISFRPDIANVDCPPRDSNNIKDSG